MNKLLGSRLRAQRVKFGITQQEVADMLKVDRSTYSYYETGRTAPSIESLYNLSVAFGVTADELIRHVIDVQSPTITPFCARNNTSQHKSNK